MNWVHIDVIVHPVGQVRRVLKRLIIAFRNLAIAMEHVLVESMDLNVNVYHHIRVMFVSMISMNVLLIHVWIMEHVIIISVDFIVDVQEDILVGLNEEMFFFQWIWRFFFAGSYCENPPSECQRFQQINRRIKCPYPSLCVANDTEKLKQINQLSTYTCQNERQIILDTYFTCIHNQSLVDCHCPSSNFSIKTIKWWFFFFWN